MAKDPEREKSYREHSERVRDLTESVKPKSESGPKPADPRVEEKPRPTHYKRDNEEC